MILASYYNDLICIDELHSKISLMMYVILRLLLSSIYNFFLVDYDFFLQRARIEVQIRATLSSRLVVISWFMNEEAVMKQQCKELFELKAKLEHLGFLGVVWKFSNLLPNRNPNQMKV